MKHVIVGAGIVGACAAYYLSQKQEHEIVLIDMEMDGKATSAGAGIICPWISRTNDPGWFKLAARGAQYYPDLIESLHAIGEADTGYAFTGALATSTDVEALNVLKEKTERQKAKFPVVGDIKVLEAPKAQMYFPPLREDLHALYISGSARLDGRMLSKALVNGCRKNGSTVLEGQATLAQEGNRVEVYVGDEHIEADEVIVSAGVWTNDLLEPLGISLNVAPQRGQIVHLGVDEDTSDWPVVLPQDSSHYIVSFDDNRVAFGATREEDSGFDYRVTAGGVLEVLNQGLAVAPGLKTDTLQDIRVGFRPMSPDVKPLLGRHPGTENMIIATGSGPSGLTTGPYVGSLAAKVALDEAVDIDLTPYNPLR